jgi:hypothetical protein
MTPSFPTFFIASARNLPISRLRVLFVFAGYLLGASPMIGAAAVAARFCIAAERKPLELVPQVLSVVE